MINASLTTHNLPVLPASEAFCKSTKERIISKLKHGYGSWYIQLATFLAKLPLRAARNVIYLLYNILKEILYFALHPLKTLTRLAKLFVTICYKMATPESLALMGSGVIGATLGFSILSGNLLSVIGVAMGGDDARCRTGDQFFKSSAS